MQDGLSAGKRLLLGVVGSLPDAMSEKLAREPCRCPETMLILMRDWRRSALCNTLGVASLPDAAHNLIRLWLACCSAGMVVQAPSSVLQTGAGCPFGDLSQTVTTEICCNKVVAF
jgi:hypothetical protein